MRYVDIGTINSSSRGPAIRSSGSPRGTKKKSRIGKTVRWAVGAVFLGALVFGIYSVLPPIQESLASMLNGTSTVAQFLVEGKQELKQENGRTNVLLLGIDKRADEPYTFAGSNGVVSRNCFRTDTMIVASYNHDTKQVTMLSLPRDLWVKIPAFGKFSTQSTKINAAYCFGDQYGYPAGEYSSGGMALSAQIISEYLDIPIQYGARVDFDGFKDAIEAVGGVDVDVERAFVDNAYPIEGKETAWPESARYKVLKIAAGPQHMDGATALAYARSRHAAGIEGTDFARSKRQQKVIAAFMAKVFSSSSMNVSSLTGLYKSLGDSFATNVAVGELPTAYEVAKDVDMSAFKSYNLDDRNDNPGGLLHAPPMADYGGAYVLVPDDPTLVGVRGFVQTIFSDEGLPEPTPSVTPTPIGATTKPTTIAR